MIATSVAYALTRFGRPMTLRRRGTPPIDAVVIGTGPRGVAPSDPAAGTVQSDAKATITPGLGAIGAPPRRGDLLIADGRTYTVQDSMARMDGGMITAYDLLVRGG